jgi:hypothetical protein
MKEEEKQTPNQQEPPNHKNGSVDFGAASGVIMSAPINVMQEKWVNLIA